MLGVRYFILLVLIPYTFACSTLSKEECNQGDWYNVGLRDGQHGYQTSRMQNHIKACSEYGVNIDSQTYNKGHADGVKVYCTPENGFQVGTRGDTYQQVCPPNLATGFLKTYRRGYKIFELRRDIKHVDSQLQDSYQKIGDPKVSSYERGVATGRIAALTYEKSSKERELAVLEAQANGQIGEPGQIATDPVTSTPTTTPTTGDGPIGFIFDTYKPTGAIEEWVFEMTATRTDGSKLPKRKYTLRLKANKNSESIVNTHKLEMANSVGKFKTIDVDPANIGDAIQAYYKQNPSEEWVAWLGGVWEGRLKRNGAMTWSGNPGNNGSTLEGSGMKLQVVSNCVWNGRQGYRVKVTGTGDEIDKCQIADVYFPTWSLVKKPSFNVEAKLVKFDRK